MSPAALRSTEVGAKSRLPLAFSVPKREDQHNEDSFYRSSKGVYALSDGASVSFDSASWARILVRRYTRNPEFTREWLSAAIAEFRELYDRDSLPWMQQASFDRGSFASLLGIISLVYWFTQKSRTLRTDDEAVYSPAGTRVPFPAITGLGKKKWDAKGLATVLYKIDGRKGRFILDDYKFDYEATHQILTEIEEKLTARVD